MEYKKLNIKARSCMFVATTISTVIILAIVIAIYFGVRTELPIEYHNILNLIVILIISINIINLVVSPFIRYKRYKYCINGEKIDVIEGLFFVTRTIVPIERIHKVTLQKGPIDNIFGLSKVIVTTAGGDATIRFLEEDKADEIVETLKSKINEIVKGQGVK